MALRIAQSEIDKADELARMKDVLLTLPRGVPVGIQIMAVGGLARYHRGLAADLLDCDPLSLED